MDDQRRDEILDAGLDVLIELGFQKTTMIAIARKASASKETLYSWFGDKEGFFEALIRRNATGVDQSLNGVGDVRAGLVLFGVALLRLLTSDGVVALNRAAIAEAGPKGKLGPLLALQGRETSMPILRAFLEEHGVNGAGAGEVYLGLLKGDWQISRLLGVMDAPSDAQIEARAVAAADGFLKLYGTSAS